MYVHFPFKSATYFLFSQREEYRTKLYSKMTERVQVVFAMNFDFTLHLCCDKLHHTF